MAAVLTLLTILVSLTQISAVQDENQFIYNGFNGANLLLSGIAKIHLSGLLELTNTSKQEIGRAFVQFPVRFNKSSLSLSFSTSFVFAMVPEIPTHGGHGIAFTLSPSTEFRGAMATQYFGLLNTDNDGSSSNHLLAIELDSTRSPDLDDINANHVGIDVNSLKSVESAPVTYLEEHDKRNESLGLISGRPLQVWIDYDELESLLNVTVAPIRFSKPGKPLLSKNINLSHVFLDSMFVGFSASTGSVASHHYILGWSFSRRGKAQEIDISKLPSLPKSKKKPNLKVMISLIISCVLIMTASVATYFLLRRKKYAEVREEWEKQYGPQRFCYKELHKAAKGFRERELLGAGGFGRVYRGTLQSSNTEIAIKKVSHESTQGMKEFVAEIASMGRVRHRNLVQLLGYCRRKGELFLVYDYMPNGSLDKFLFSNAERNLSWSQRYRILKGVASGLLYLHEGWEQVIIHRDIKASNVLLDADYNGRLGDFGLAKFYDHGENPQTTRVVGTVGYIAPELTRTGKPTTSSDVYAFGNFLLEIACGRRPFEPRALPEEMFLAEWVYESWKSGNILNTVDHRLEGNYVAEELGLVLKLGLLCADSKPETRPSMMQVVQYLDKNALLRDLPLDIAPTEPHSAVVPYQTSSESTACCHVSFDNISSQSWSSGNSIFSAGR